jgi:hypothetical protein
MPSSVTDRFLRYVVIDTQSDGTSQTQPSTEKQKDLGRLLVEELIEIGVTDAHLDEYGYVYATIPPTSTKNSIPSSASAPIWTRPRTSPAPMFVLRSSGTTRVGISSCLGIRAG